MNVKLKLHILATIGNGGQAVSFMIHRGLFDVLHTRTPISHIWSQ